MKPEEARDPLPGPSASLEEVAEFWDTHDTTDYEDVFETVDAKFNVRRRHFEVEVREDIFQALRQRSKRLHVPVEEILDSLLRDDLLPSRTG